MKQDKIPYMPRLAIKKTFLQSDSPKRYVSLYVACSVNMWYGFASTSLKTIGQKPRFLIAVKTLSTCINIDYPLFFWPGSKLEKVIRNFPVLRGGGKYHFRFSSCFNLPVICLSSDSEVIRNFTETLNWMHILPLNLFLRIIPHHLNSMKSIFTGKSTLL